MKSILGIVLFLSGAQAFADSFAILTCTNSSWRTIDSVQVLMEIPEEHKALYAELAVETGDKVDMPKYHGRSPFLITTIANNKDGSVTSVESYYPYLWEMPYDVTYFATFRFANKNGKIFLYLSHHYKFGWLSNNGIDRNLVCVITPPQI